MTINCNCESFNNSLCHVMINFGISRSMFFTHKFTLLLYFTAEAPTCFDSYNQPRLGGGRLFEHAALNCGSTHLSQLAPCCPVAE